MRKDRKAPSLDEPATEPAAPALAREAKSTPPVFGSAAPTTRQRVSRYELLFELARGGMGTVFIGRAVGDHGFDRLVAVKLLPKERASAEDLAAFVSEARITARINHANVVDTFEFGVGDVGPFLVMQVIDGLPFSRLLAEMAARGETLDPDLVAWIGTQAALGLNAAHELTSPTGESLGIVHRDVSPQNLLLSYEGRVYVADFGVARLLEGERLTASGVVKGKFAYMSPEQTRAELVDRRSDVFSLGVVLHEALVGKPLFSAASPADSVFQINHKKPVAPHLLLASVPEDLSRVVMRCLERDRRDRFDSAAEVATALRAALRARRATVDESDLASVLERFFSDERAALKKRIQRALSEEQGPENAQSSIECDGAPFESEADAASAPHKSLGSVTATVGAIPGLPTRAKRISRWALVALAGSLLVGLVVFVWPRDQARTVSPPERAAAASSPAPSATAMRELPTSSPTTIDTAVPIQSSAPTVAAMPSKPVRTTRALPPSSPDQPMPTPAPSATTSHRGEPFRALSP